MAGACGLLPAEVSRLGNGGWRANAPRIIASARSSAAADVARRAFSPVQSPNPGLAEIAQPIVRMVRVWLWGKNCR